MIDIEGTIDTEGMVITKRIFNANEGFKTGVLMSFVEGVLRGVEVELVDLVIIEVSRISGSL